MIVTHSKEDLATAAWIDLLDATDDETARVTTATGLRVPTQNEISEIESTSRLAFENSAYYLSSPLVAHGTGNELVLTPVGFVLSQRVLITVRFSALHSFNAAHQLCAAHEVRSAEEAFLRIFELIVDGSADKLEAAGAECDDLSRRTFRST